MAARLATRAVSRAYAAPDGGEPVRALDPITLEFSAGEFVAIVGPSGCGKSTLFNILAGLLEPTEGEVLIDGTPTDDLLGRVGYMPQKDLLMPWRSVLDNVIIGQLLRGVPKDVARARAREQLPRFGLAGFEHHWPSQLSGGMRQRAALLRTLLTKRDVLLLDEPFGALDALTRQGMQSWLLDIWSEERKTIVLVTHDVEEAIYLADRVVVLTGRPGGVATVITVDLPRPRPLELITDPSFIALKDQVMRPLRQHIAQTTPEAGAHR